MSTDAHTISVVDSLNERAYIQIRLKTEYDVAMHNDTYIHVYCLRHGFLAADDLFADNLIYIFCKLKWEQDGHLKIRVLTTQCASYCKMFLT